MNPIKHDTMCRNIAIGGKVYATKDPSIFTPYGKNRDIVRSTVNKVKKGIKTGKWLKMGILTCVVIDDRLVCIDGNNRLKGDLECVESGITDTPIYYVVLDKEYLAEQGITVDEYIQTMNNDRKNWGVPDWVKFYSDNGNEQYRRLVELGKVYFPSVKKDGSVKPNYKYLTAFVTGGESSFQRLKSGELEIKMSDKVLQYHYGILTGVLKVLGSPKSNSWYEQFINGWFQFYNDPETRMALDEVGVGTYTKALKEVCSKMQVDKELFQSTTFWVELHKKTLLSI